MSDNIKRLKEFLLKHIEQVNNETKQAEALILQAKQNKAANTIKSAVKSLIKKTDKKYKALGDYICTGLIKKKKEEYRLEILKKLEEKGTPHVIKNLYLYYCKLGQKVFGFDELAKKGEKYLFKKILNSIFVNTGFKSTNFTTIHFKLCKFLQGFHGQVHMDLLKRDSNLRSERIHKSGDTMEFDKTRLENCLFEECDFFGVEFKNLQVGSIIIKENLDDKFDREIVETTRFYKCNFKFNTKFIYSNHESIVKRTGNFDVKYDMTFSKVNNLLGKVQHNKNVINISRTLITHSPDLIFEECKFDNFVFMSESTINAKTDQTLFLNCEFNGELDKYSFYKLDFISVNFIGCKFKNINFKRINFKYFKFEACELINCNFDDCQFLGTCCIIANKTKLKETKFNTCFFSSSKDILSSCIITSDCILNEVTFLYCGLINFVFNYESVKSGSEVMLNMKNCKFICNDLLGTNFDYCDLEGGDFAARVNCVEQINWLGRGFSKIKIGSKLLNLIGKDIIKEIDISVGDILHDKFGLEKKIMITLAIPGKTDIYQLKNGDYTHKGYTNVEEFIRFKNINAWDCFKTYDGSLLYFIPPTSFNEANIKTCRFQGLDGFESFDFTKIAKDSAGRPNLNAANFTNVDLTNANMTNCNLIGTVFQVAKVTGVNFSDALTNENTDFENTIDIGLALNAQNINFGELQNNANETHARAQFIINNREKYKEFYASCQDPARLESVLHVEGDDAKAMIKIKEMYEEMIKIIKTGRNIHESIKRNIKVTFDKFIIMILIKKVKYSAEQLRKLKTDFQSIMSNEFVNILTSQKNQLQGGTEGKWCWLELVLDSLLFLFHCPATYIFNFFEFYFFDIFNSHGAGGTSCTLGMVERLVNIHTQVSEKFLMSMDLKPTPEIVDALKHYNEGNPTAVDDEITEDFIIRFNDPSKLSEPNNCKAQLHKYALNKFVNLLKPNSTLPEQANEDIGIVFDYTIKSQWRDEFEEEAKSKVNSGNIKTLDELCEFYLGWIGDKIILENGITTEIYEEIKQNGGKKLELLNSKILELNKFLKENEIPKFKEAIIVMTSSEVTYEDLKKYFEGGGKRRKKTAKKAGGLSQTTNSSSSSRKTKSAPAPEKLSLSKLDRVIVQKFVKLPKEKVREVFEKVCEPAVKFFPPNMSTEYTVYREILENKFKTMKINNLLLLEDEKALSNYENSMKKRFSSVSKSPKKTGSPRIRISRPSTHRNRPSTHRNRPSTHRRRRRPDTTTKHSRTIRVS